MANNNYHQYKHKLTDIQHALTILDTDKGLIVTIYKEMAFNWVPALLDEMNLLIEENKQLIEDTSMLNIQNDALLKQNILLTERLQRQ